LTAGYWRTGRADAGHGFRAARDGLFPRRANDPLAVRLQEGLSLGVGLASQRVVVPGGPIELEDEALVGPAEPRARFESALVRRRSRP